MVKIEYIQEGIMEDLVENANSHRSIPDIVSHSIQQTADIIEDIVLAINAGSTALFVDGENQCYLFETTQVVSRGIESSQNEVILKGAKEAFNKITN